MKLLLLADIHGNFPALEAVDRYFADTAFEYIINCGDSVVYAPFPNEVLDWLRHKQAVSILGNTDKKVLKILKGQKLKKPADPEKRIMYESTAAQLTPSNMDYLRSFPASHELELSFPAKHTPETSLTLGIHHGSPAHPHEFLFESTNESRFLELAEDATADIIVSGHSHSPYHKHVGGIHFINPGSTGRMFDGDPSISCAVLDLQNAPDNRPVKRQSAYQLTGSIHLLARHHRIPYDTSLTINEIHRQKLPPIYEEMFRIGRKLN